MKKNIISAFVLGLALSLGTAIVNVPNYTISVAEANAAVQAGVKWNKGSEAEIVAIGIGLPPEKAHKARANVLARRAAIVDGYRNLAEFAEGVNVDANTTIKEMTTQSDVVNVNVNAVIRGAEIVEEGWNNDGSYYIVMKMPMFGTKGLASAVMPSLVKSVGYTPVEKVEPAKSTLGDTEVRKFKATAGTFTGVVVDASGLGLEPTFSPIIYDTNGRAIYGVKNIDKDFAISQGMVWYVGGLNQLAACSRAGANPIIVKAVTVKSGPNSVNPVNVVVSPEDGDRILLANENSSLLENCQVVFVR